MKGDVASRLQRHELAKCCSKTMMMYDGAPEAPMLCEYERMTRWKRWQRSEVRYQPVVDRGYHLWKQSRTRKSSK